MDHDALIELLDRASGLDATSEEVLQAQEATEDLFAAHQDRVYSLCRCFVDDPAEALQLSHTATLVSARCLGEWRGAGPLWPWMYEITRDVCHRARIKKQQLLTTDGVLIPGSEATRVLGSLRHEVWEELLRGVGLDVLETDEQEVVYLRYVEGLEVQQINEVLRLEGTGARGMLQRCRHKLGRVLQRHPGVVEGRLAHPPLAEIAPERPSPEARVHLQLCPRCRVDRHRVRSPVLAPRRELEAARPKLAEARSGPRATITSSWRSAAYRRLERGELAALELLPDGVQLGPYHLDGLIAHTSLAVVYHAVHEETGRLHALKLLATTDPGVRGSLQREARTLGELHHDNVASIDEYVEVDGHPGLVLAFVDGPSLEDLLRAEVLLPWSLIDALAIDLLDGVAAAHAAGLQHQDLRPAHVLLDTSGPQLRARITGFGLTQALSALEQRAPHGSPAYRAPEQLRSGQRPSTAGDVFALGALLYELTTGQICFAGLDPTEVRRRVSGLIHPPLQELRPGIPERMVHAIEAALRPDPAARPRSAAALLDLWTRGAGAAGRPASPLEEGRASALQMLRPIAALPEPSGADELVPSTLLGRTPLPTADGTLEPQGDALAAFLGVVGIGGIVAVGVLWSTLVEPVTVGPAFWRLARGVEAVDPALSPDAHSVLFSDQRDLYLLHLEARQPILLTADFDPPASEPTWAPDGVRIAFVAAGGVWVAELVDDALTEPRELVRDATAPAWAPTGDAIAFVTTSRSSPRPTGLVVLDLQTDQRVPVVFEGTGSPGDPDWSPDGQRLAWSTPDGLAIASRSGEPTANLVLPAHASPVWLDDHTLAVLGPLADAGLGIKRLFEGTDGGFGVPEDWVRLPLRPRSFDAAPGGARLVVGLDRSTATTLHLDLQQATVDVGESQDTPLQFPALDPHSGALAAVERPRDGHPQRLVLRRSPTSPWQILVQGATIAAPTWRPGGSRITFTAELEGQAGVYEISPDGADLRLISDPTLSWTAPPHWSPDGELLAWTDRGFPGGMPVVLDPKVPWAPQIIAARRAPLDGAEAGPFSPDGRRLLIRGRDDRFGVIELESGATVGGPIEATSVVWEGDDALLIAEASELSRLELATGARTPLADLDPWRAPPDALALGPRQTVWITARRELGGLQRVELP
ncbi:MAG TPA: hypothetical protein ENK18_17530 [Deltaproteobacteria bacterium]|nr:hypothetical protein [Deltaproteobacteria bacterium]